MIDAAAFAAKMINLYGIPKAIKRAEDCARRNPENSAFWASVTSHIRYLAWGKTPKPDLMRVVLDGLQSQPDAVAR